MVCDFEAMGKSASQMFYPRPKKRFAWLFENRPQAIQVAQDFYKNSLEMIKTKQLLYQLEGYLQTITDHVLKFLVESH